MILEILKKDLLIVVSLEYEYSVWVIDCVVILIYLQEPDLAAIAQREEENHSKAEERYREALNELKSQRLKDQERQSRWAGNTNFTSHVWIWSEWTEL